MESLTSRIPPLQNKFGNHDQKWVQYVRDHRQFLLKASVARTITSEDMFIYQYRLADYLRKLHQDPSSTWIVMYLNQIDSDVNFMNLTSILVPDITELSNMYAQYETFASNLSVSESMIAGQKG